MNNFEKWWYETGSGIAPLPNHDHKEHAERMTRIAWGVATEALRKERDKLRKERDEARLEDREAADLLPQGTCPSEMSDIFVGDNDHGQTFKNPDQSIFEKLNEELWNLRLRMTEMRDAIVQLRVDRDSAIRERDEARRDLCFHEILLGKYECLPITEQTYAKERGWDCYDNKKEKTP